MINKIQTLICVSLIILINGICTATEQPVRSEAGTQSNVGYLNDIREKWFRAVNSNDEGEIARIIGESGVDVINAKNNAGETALHITARDVQKNKIYDLIKKQPSQAVNAVDAKGETPLFGAIKNRNNAVAQELMGHRNINVEVINEDGETLVYLVSKCGNGVIINALFPHLINKKITLSNQELKDMASTCRQDQVIGSLRSFIDNILKYMLAERTFRSDGEK
jgi:ankyrin repeat protein